MSVVLEDLALRLGRNPAVILEGHEGFGLVAFLAGLARRLEQKVVLDPIPDEPAHAHVVGIKTKKTSRAFAKESNWVVVIPV